MALFVKAVSPKEGGVRPTNLSWTDRHRGMMLPSRRALPLPLRLLPVCVCTLWANICHLLGGPGKRHLDEGLPDAVLPIDCGIPLGGWPVTLIYVLRLWDRKCIGSQHLPPCRHVQPRHALVARGLVARCNGDIELNCLLQASLQLFFFPRGASSPLLS
jgi:hypothetical protein